MNENEKIVPAFDEKHDESLDIILERVSEIDKGLILKLIGYVDTYNTNLFQKRVNSAIDAGYIRLIFDCIRLNYFSSTGIGSFTSFLKAVKSRGGDIVLFGMQSKLTDIFKLLGFSQFFAIKSTREEAIEYFQGTMVKSTSQDSISRFPKVIQCPTCRTRLRAVKAGRFRCSHCKSIFVVDANAHVSAG